MDLTDLILLPIAFLGATVAAFWMSMVIWTFRDIRSRTRDLPTQFLATLLVAVLNVPGLLIYLILRPRETLAEAYERALEEELILQTLEEIEQCPACGRRVKAEFIVCPYCHTRLKQRCPRCQRPLRLEWTLCPYCGVSVSGAAPSPALAAPARGGSAGPE
jgi:RNA polymerase subunit RPABC4/transcription elongation factor Spt4